MFILNDTDNETFGDDVLSITPLEELSQDLLEDCIDGQIQSPYDASTNFLEEFHMMLEAQLDNSLDNDDATEETKKIARNFYCEILRKFDEHFSLEIDWELVNNNNIEGLRNLAEGIYEFFIIRFSKHVAKCITKIILDNLDQLSDSIDNSLAAGNVSTESYEMKLANAKFARILSNINQVVAEVKSIPLVPETFLEYFNKDRFEIAIMDYSVNNHIINGNFVPRYLYPIYKELQDDVYDAIVLEVHERLFQKFKKAEPITFEQFQEDVEEED